MSKLFKSKFFIGVLVVAALVGAVGYFSNTASAQSCSITVTLKVGSKGAEVMCLQSVVGVTADGSFGPKTKAAVMAWQSAHGLVADGVFGAKSRAAFVANGSVSGQFPAGCQSASGYSTTTGMPCTSAGSTGNLPAGCTSSVGFSPTTGASCSGSTTGVVTLGQGSATLDYEPIPASGVNIYTGASKTAGVTFKIKATGSDMKISSLALDVDKRIWLDASNAYLMQGSTVLATLPLSSATVTEVTTNTLWRLLFTGLNVVAPANQNTDLTVAFDRPTVTQNNDTVTIQTSSYVRATDGTGFTSNVSPTGTRTMTFTASSASQGTLTSSLDAGSPAAQSVTGLSVTSGVLTPVKIMDFDLKGTNSPITVTTLAGTATASTGTIANEVASWELRDGSTVLSSVTGGAAASFSSLNVQVPKDGTKTLSIWAQMNPIGTPGAGFTSKGAGITFTLTPASTVAYDANFNTVTDSSANVASNTQYMYQYAPTITLGATTATTTNTSGSISADYSLSFTVTAPSGQNIYIDQAVAAVGSDNIVVKTTPANGGTVADSTPMTASATNGTDGVTWPSFIVLAGQSRTFTVYAHVPVGGSAGYTGVKLTQVLWNTVDSSTGATTQTWGLQNFNTASVYVTAS